MGKYHLTEPGIFEPGQYWGMLTVNGQTIHFCPKDIVNDVKEKFNISNENVIKLNMPFNPEQRKRLKQEFPGQKDNIQSLSATGIFEDLLPAIDNDGKFGLRLFEMKMEGSRQDKDILIHCSAGQNRTPVGVVLYMMKFHSLSYDKASNAFEQALGDCNIRGNRTPEIQLNVNEHYTHVLDYAKTVYSQKNPAQSSSSATASTSQPSGTSTAKASKKRPLELKAAKVPSKSAKPTQKMKAKQSTRSNGKEAEEEVDNEEQLVRKKQSPAKKLPTKSTSKSKSKKAPKKAAKDVRAKIKSKRASIDDITKEEAEHFIKKVKELEKKQTSIRRPRPATQIGARDRWGGALRSSIKKPDSFNPSSDNSFRYRR